MRKEYRLVIDCDDDDLFDLVSNDALNGIHNTMDDYSEATIILQEIDI